MRRVYLDNNATTRVDPGVVEAMMPTFDETYGNAASFQHPYGRAASDLVEAARATIAATVGARAQEVCFTSGATESNNLALCGVLGLAPGAGLVTVATEHKSVLDTAAELERRGHPVSFAEVDQFGVVSLESLAEAIRPETVLVSIMAANNEIGTLAQVGEIAEVCHQRGVLFHCDATQGLGRMYLDVKDLGIAMLSISAHKVYGPKGVGALVVRRGVHLKALINGGGHERGLRSGTLNVPGCVGFAAACELARELQQEDASHCLGLRNRLWSRIGAGIPEAQLNGHPVQRLAGNLNLYFPGCDAEDLMLAMPDVAVSSGSACTSASPAPSHVLRAIGLSYEEAQCSVRFGVGRFNTVAEIDYAADRVIETVRAVQRMPKEQSRVATP